MTDSSSIVDPEIGGSRLQVANSREGPGRVRSGYKNWKPVCSWDPEARTVLDIILHTVGKYSSHPAQGSRFFEGFKDIGQRC